MDIVELKQNFKIYMRGRFPNDSNISSTVSMAFFLDRYGHEFGMDFQRVITDRTIPADYKLKLEEYFQKRSRKDPRGNASVYERSLRLLLEYIGGQILPQPKRFIPTLREIECKEIKPMVASSQSINKSTSAQSQNYSNKRAGEHLVQIGMERFTLKSEHPWVHLTGIEKYDMLLNDLVNTPHAFVLACLMDKQIKAERAWGIPCIVMEEFGTDIRTLYMISEEDYIAFFNRNTLHRFNNEMGKVFTSGVQRIVDYYDSNASIIWKDKPSSAKVVYDFLQFRGAGVKIATMAVNILARQFQIEFADYYSIDVSPDVHIRRVMYRMGLVDDESNTDAVIYKARELNPEFPGIIDFSAWEIGREYCRPSNPRCSICSVNVECLRRL